MADFEAQLTKYTELERSLRNASIAQVRLPPPSCTGSGRCSDTLLPRTAAAWTDHRRALRCGDAVVDNLGGAGTAVAGGVWQGLVRMGGA